MSQNSSVKWGNFPLRVPEKKLFPLRFVEHKKQKGSHFYNYIAKLKSCSRCGTVLELWDIQYSTCNQLYWNLLCSHSAASCFLSEFIKVYAHLHCPPDVTSTHHPLLLAALPAHSPNLSHLPALRSASSSAAKGGRGPTEGLRCQPAMNTKTHLSFFLTPFTSPPYCQAPMKQQLKCL